MRSSPGLPRSPLWRERRSGDERRLRGLPVLYDRRNGLGRRNDPSPTLRGAAKRVADNWQHHEDGEAFSPQEINDLLSALVAAVLHAMARDTDPPDPRLTSVLGRRLLELLRAELVQQWGTGEQTPPSHSILAVLSAFETVRRSTEPNWAQHFTSRLSGLDGLGLVLHVAHDFRSPLSAILFLADLMLKGRSGTVSELQYRQLGLIYSATLGLSELASNVIEMSSDANRLAEDKPSPFSLAEILESVSSIVSPMAEEKGVNVRFSPPTEDHRLGHPRALSRVLLNLTTNALKFTEQGYVEIAVQETTPTRVEFSVRDTGRGIDPSRLETLYDPFRRTAEGGRVAFSGTGLGLSLCRRLLKMMRSELQVESRKGWGTRFSFELDLPLATRLSVDAPSLAGGGVHRLGPDAPPRLTPGPGVQGLQQVSE